MFCPSCGVKIPDNSKFCFSCGNRIELTAVPAVAQPIEWEYGFFINEWSQKNGGGYDLSEGRTEQHARIFFWNDIQENVLPDLQRFLDKGWEPISEVGPSSLIFWQNNQDPYKMVLRACRVKIRRQRQGPLSAQESGILGRWQYLEMKGGSFLVRSVMGLAALSGGGQFTTVDFLRENRFEGQNSKGSGTGIYHFQDGLNFYMVSDSKSYFRVVGELNSTFDEMVIHQYGGMEAYYRKVS